MADQAKTKSISISKGTSPTQQALDSKGKSVANDLLTRGILPGTAEYKRAYQDAMSGETQEHGGAKGRTGMQPAKDTRLASVLAALDPNNRTLRAIIASGAVKPGS